MDAENNDEESRQSGTAKRSLKQKLGLGFASRRGDEMDEVEEEGQSRFGIGRRASQRRKGHSPYRKSHEWLPGQKSGTTDRPQEQGGTLPSIANHSIPRKQGLSVSEGSTGPPSQYLASQPPVAMPYQGQRPPPGAGAGSAYASAHLSIPAPPQWPATYSGHNAQGYQPYRAPGYPQDQLTPAGPEQTVQGPPRSSSEMLQNPAGPNRFSTGPQRQQGRPASPLDFGGRAVPGRTAAGPVDHDTGESQSAPRSRTSSDARVTPVQTPVSAIGPNRPRMATQMSSREDYRNGPNPGRGPGQELTGDEVNTLVKDHRELSMYHDLRNPNHHG